MGVQVSPLAPRELMKSIILVGFMGSGKTRIGKELSKRIGLPFFDSDRVIERRFGKISDIFEKKGEQHFRELEYNAIKEILDLPEAVVLSVGGGAFCVEKTVQLMLQKGTLFFLDCPFEICYTRIRRRIDRPLLKNGKGWLRELYKKRIEFYRKAKFRIDSSKSVNIALDAILSKLDYETADTLDR